jgi:hypothetical protein
MYRHGLHVVAMAFVAAAFLATSASAEAAPRDRRAALPKFSDYPASPAGLTAKAPIKITNEDRMYRSQLCRGYAKPVNSAGKYVLTYWGCGMECLMGAAIDAETGTIHWLPGTVCCWFDASPVHSGEGR